MKNIMMLSILSVLVLLNASCTKPDYKKVVEQFIQSTSDVKDYEIREVGDTASPDWKAVVVYVPQGPVRNPFVFFVSSDGKSVIPNAMVFVNGKPIFEKQLKPEAGKIGFALTEKDRIVINPAGTKTVFMFTDPDCPYCLKARETLKTYSGEYRVVLKHFPLEGIHPEARAKAVAEQAAWLKNLKKDLSGDAILAEAKKIVEEDMAEAMKAGLQGVPTYVMEDGSMQQGLF